MNDIAAEHSARLTALIRNDAEANGGLLTFDRFMELALYAPGLGYYVAGAEKLGAAGDFVTAPEISPLFGRALARPCFEVFDGLGGGDLLELGAGSGALAIELLLALEARGRLPHRYLILEPSPELAARQRALVDRRVPRLRDRIIWLSALPETFTGLVLANEVIDAMPVHRFCIGEDGAVGEVLVEPAADGFGERVATPISAGLADAVRGLQACGLARDSGYCSEVSLRLGPWMAALARMLTRGLVLLVDYGYPRSEYYLPERRGGTLMCHYRHRAHDDPYRHIGLQDITAHVDFTALAEAGTAAGLSLLGYTTQSSFLLGCGLDALLSEAMAADPTAAMDLAAGARQLLLPTRMGERFQVMALGRDLAVAPSGFGLRDLSRRL